MLHQLLGNVEDMTAGQPHVDLRRDTISSPVSVLRTTFLQPDKDRIQALLETYRNVVYLSVANGGPYRTQVVANRRFTWNI